MVEKYITLNKMEDVERFVDIAVEQPFEVDLISGRYIVNAKSIMGVFSLDLAKPILMKAECPAEQAAAFVEKTRPFLAE